MCGDKRLVSASLVFFFLVQFNSSLGTGFNCKNKIVTGTSYLAIEELMIEREPF